MSQVSKNQLNSKIYTRIFSLFPQFLSRMINRGKLNIFVDEFFSSTEKIVIAKRVAIAYLLVKGYTYDIICSKLKVSHGTVAKVSTLLHANDRSIISELESMAKEEVFIEFINAIGYQVETLLPPKGRNWSKWRSQIEKEKDNSEIVL